MPDNYFLDFSQIPEQARALLRLQGEDAERFLQGVLTSDVGAMLPNEAQPSALLTMKGKIMSELVILRTKDGSFILVVPSQTADEVIAVLNRFIIMDDVSVEREQNLHVAFIWPELPLAPPLLLQVFKTRHPAPGFLLLGSPRDVRAYSQHCQMVDEGLWTKYRVQTLSPAWAREIMANRFPPEVGYGYAVSYTKGCFLGQEPLARLKARGHVNWMMVAVKAATIPTEILELASDSRPQAGHWTSWTSTLEGVRGLAIVHRTLAQPGSILYAPNAADIGSIEVV